MPDGPHASADGAGCQPLPTLDRDQLAELRSLSPEGDPWLIRELIEPFLRGCRHGFAELQDACRQIDPVQVERVAHNLKGACGTIGVRALADVARQIMEAARAGKLKEIPRLLTLFEAEHTRVAAALRNEFPALPADPID